MKVISHRGYWKSLEERNRPVAFERSFYLGFGTETDVRDRGGELVIAHDMAKDIDITFESFLDILAARPLPLAINIKADGLGAALLAAMNARGLSNWFAFDMAVPDMIQLIALNIPVFTRVSEFERSPACYDQSIGVWLDSFGPEWFGPSDIETFLRDGKDVCVVSPELHGRDPSPAWDAILGSGIRSHPRLMLCTDRPEEAAALLC